MILTCIIAIIEETLLHLHCIFALELDAMTSWLPWTSTREVKEVEHNMSATLSTVIVLERAVFRTRVKMPNSVQ